MSFTVTIDCSAPPYYTLQDVVPGYNEVEYVGRLTATLIERGRAVAVHQYDGYVATVKGDGDYANYILGDDPPPFRRVLLVRFGFTENAFWQFERRGSPPEISELVRGVVVKLGDVAAAAGLFDQQLYVIFHEEPNPMKDGVVLHRPLRLLDIQVSTGAFAKLMVAFESAGGERRCFAHVSPREVSFVSQADLVRRDEPRPGPEGRQIQLEDS